MRLTEEQKKSLSDNGYIIIPELYSSEELDQLRQGMDRVFRQNHEANVIEKHSGQIRTAMALHLRDEIFRRLVRHPRFVEPVLEINGEDVYIQQVKINVKAAFEGEAWQWHHDFATHHHDDGVREPLALNCHVFLDDVFDVNGPLYFIPGSHMGTPAPSFHDTETTSYDLWCTEQEAVRELAEAGGVVAATGKAGTALIFRDSLVHGSPPNFSPWNRSIFSVIYNPISNAYTKTTRPDHKHHRSLDPVMPLGDDCLIEPVAA